MFLKCKSVVVFLKILITVTEELPPISTSQFNFFIGFVGLCPGLGKAGMPKLQPAEDQLTPTITVAKRGKTDGRVLPYQLRTITTTQRVTA